MSEMPKYHPQIEENFVTEGEDIGRTKNTDLVQNMANTQNDIFDEIRGTEFEQPSAAAFVEHEQRNTDNFMKSELAKKAMVGAMDAELHNIAAHAINDVDSNYNATAIDSNKLRQEADRVVADYDDLQSEAERQRVSRGEVPEATIKEAVHETRLLYEAHRGDQGEHRSDDIWRTLTSSLAYHLGFTGFDEGKSGSTFSNLTPDQMKLVQSLYKDIVD